MLNQNIEEISLVRTVKTLWQSRKTLIWSLIISGILGLIVAFSSIKYWKTSAVLLPENQNSSISSSSLDGLASIAGVNLSGQSGDAIDPELFPVITESTPFLLYLLDSDVYSERLGSNIKLREFLSEHSSKSLIQRIGRVPRYVTSMFKGSSEKSDIKSKFVEITDEDFDLIELLSSSIEVVVNRKTGIVEFTAELQDPLITSSVVQLSIDYISNFVFDYKTGKERRKLEFLKDQLLQKRGEYDEAHKQLANFKDSNIGAMNNVASIELRKLENHYDLAFSLYTQLREQVEQAKIAVEDNTPVFQIIEPVKRPLLRSKPKKLLILLSSMALGIMVVSAFILIKDQLRFLVKVK